MKKMINPTTTQAPQIRIQLKKEKQKTNPENLITQAIDEVFSSFGNKVQQSLYELLEKGYGIKKEEIPTKTQEFQKSLEDIFGVASQLVEMKIIESLFAKVPNFAFMPKEQEFSFTEYIMSARNFCL
jgi:hypothetical protein